MNSWRWSGLAALLLLVLPALLAAQGLPEKKDFKPDPKTVQRFGPAYKYPQEGWLVVHVEGAPYERGYQHGLLLSQEIQTYVKVLGNHFGGKDPAKGWEQTRRLVNALFLRKYDLEYLEEMKGIADGAAAGGATFNGRTLDFIDIVAVNSAVELDFLDSGLHAAGTGLEAKDYDRPLYTTPIKQPHHCSAFVATGPATRDGKVVFGHITMWELYEAAYFNIWLDIKPSKGHRVMMQTYPGGIQSGMDYYMNDNGMLICETTINQTKFDQDGLALASRIRKAIQYGSDIDTAVALLREKNNGLYSNEWLLADTKTNEIAMLELGTHKSRLRRSGNKEWLGDAEGFYWGCNNTKDFAVRLETVPSAHGRPEVVVYRPSGRDITWLNIYRQNKGRIDENFAYAAFTHPELAFKNASLDAKFTTTDMAKEFKTWALFGPPNMERWEPSAFDKQQHPDIKPLVRNPWTILPGVAPQGGETVVEKNPAPKVDRPAWRGTLMPKTEADIWLAVAFAEYERIVAKEKKRLADNGDGKLTDQDKADISRMVEQQRGRYERAVKRWGQDVALAETKMVWDRNEWYEIAAAKGVLLLDDLRKEMGAETFDRFMSEVGRQYGGDYISTQDFIQAAQKAHGKTLVAFFEPRLKKTGLLVSQAAPATDDLTAKIAAYVKAQQEVNKFSGAVLVAKEGKVLFRQGCGLANQDFDLPNTPDTKFRLGSITKQFTAAAILLLEQEGKLKLEDPISKHLPELPAAWKDVTIHHLLTHTGGIPEHTNLPGFTEKAKKAMSPTQLIALIKDKPLDYTPGEKFRYCNTGYVLLGMIIENASGKKYEEFLPTRIFTPLGMKNTGYDHQNRIIKNRAVGYNYVLGQYRQADYLDMSIPFAAGGLYSTVNDLLLWDQSLYSEKLLAKESLQRMFTAPEKRTYALGWGVAQRHNRPCHSHGGGIHGFVTAISRYPNEKLFVVVLSNNQSASATVRALDRDLAAIVLGEKYEMPGKKQTTSASPK
jgi:CubicO group peptidase (beta-lactamase class C family)